MNRKNFYGNENWKISKTWFKKGLNTPIDDPDDVAVKFICYWITFNSVYSKYESDEKSEIDQIKDFMNKNYEKCFKNIIFFDKSKTEISESKPTLNIERLITKDDIDIFLKYPVLDGAKIIDENKDYINMMPRRNCWPIINFQNLVKKKCNETRIISLMCIIYKVRCNMFHGYKIADPGRNYELAYYSQIILEKLLYAYFENKKIEVY